jgi:tetratricopeptide (TPR) repeat protein
VFLYTSYGMLLMIFGGTGQFAGTFRTPSAIECIGETIYVLDPYKDCITRFNPTTYGHALLTASSLYQEGRYAESLDLWQQVIRQNGNFETAYIGIGRALMRQESYKEAMDYFKMAKDRDNYGRAFRFYRKVWVEENIGWLVLLVAAVLLIPVIRSSIRKMRMEVEVHERNQVQK